MGLVAAKDFEDHAVGVIARVGDLVEDGKQGVPFEIFEVDDAAFVGIAVCATSEAVALIVVEDGDFASEEVVADDLFADQEMFGGSKELAKEELAVSGELKVIFGRLFDEAVGDEGLEGGTKSRGVGQDRLFEFGSKASKSG